MTDLPPMPGPVIGWAATAAFLSECRETRLTNGLRTVLMRVQDVPLVEARLWLPWPAWATGDPTAQDLLAQVLTSHTHRGCPLARLRASGAALIASSDPDRLGLAACVPRTEVTALLDAFAHALTELDLSDLRRHREDLAETVLRDNGNAAVLARSAMLQLLHGEGHPYAAERPDADRLRSFPAPVLAELHQGAVRPEGAVLVVVGDMRFDDVQRDAERALGEAAWPLRFGRPPTERTGASATSRAEIVDHGPWPHWRGEVGDVRAQACIWLGALGVGATDRNYPALIVADRILGGYVSSRLFRQLRTDRGLVYLAQSWLEQGRWGARVLVEVDCAWASVPAVLDEIRGVLTELIARPALAAEVAAAVRHALGTMAVQLSSQAGVADLLLQSTTGAGARGILEQVAMLSQVAPSDVLDVAQRFLDPNRFAVAVAGT